ncbi:MAG: hypothetical protein AB7S36_19490 [Planctomycetota bacterium]
MSTATSSNLPATASQRPAPDDDALIDPESLLPEPRGFTRRDAWILGSILIYGVLAALLVMVVMQRGNQGPADESKSTPVPPMSGARFTAPPPADVEAIVPAGNGNPVEHNVDTDTGTGGALLNNRPAPANASASTSNAADNARTPANQIIPGVEGNVGIQFDGDYLILSWDVLSSFTFSNYSFADILENPALAKQHNPVPSGLLALDGKQVVITGYCWPEGRLPDGRYQTTVFRDMGSCCFGDVPQLNHFAVVHTTTPVDVPRGFVLQMYGTLTVEVEYDGDGYPIGLYTLKADKVVDRSLDLKPDRGGKNR